MVDVPIDEIRDLLFATYADFGESRRLASTLHMVRQNKDTPMAYITKFDVTLGLITAADRPREYQVIHHFVNGFNDARLKELLLNKEFPDYLACRNFAKDTLLRNPMYGKTPVWQHLADSRPERPRPVNSPRSRRPQPRRDTRRPSARLGRRVQFKRADTPVTCFRCGQPGHKAPDCPRQADTPKPRPLPAERKPARRPDKRQKRDSGK